MLEEPVIHILSLLLSRKILSTSPASASSPGNFLIYQYLDKIIQKSARHFLGTGIFGHLIFHQTADMIQHKTIRILVIQAASLIVQKLTLHFRLLLDLSGCIWVIGFHQVKLSLLFPLLIIKNRISLCSIKRIKVSIKHNRCCPLSAISYSICRKDRRVRIP